ncbi:Cytosol aminopeptidase [Holospora curviuscula]|uniref:Cytosol aminopeptidase n=2 Tax=Holospora curviuscula TaxID=1082868 RepID=A0A2S5R984_9PROT|nr:Cytosol aminopeptidase [Holospora curviuscula]
MRIHITTETQAKIPIILAVCEGKIFGNILAISQLDAVKYTLSTLSVAKGKWVDIEVESGQRVIFWGINSFESIYEIRCQGGELWTLCQTLPYDAVQIFPWSSYPQELLYGIKVRDWRFDTYRTNAHPLPKLGCKDLYVVDQGSDLSHYIQRHYGRIDSLHWARQRCNEPANVLTPQKFAQHLKEFTQFGIQVEIIEKSALEGQGFGALLGVSQGSAQDPCLAVLQWNGAHSSEVRTTLVGKGVTFDTGGISLKPSSGMEDMKMDMSGAAVVAAVIRAAAIDKLPLNLYVVIPLVENSISGSAQRPGDIVFSLSGKSIEVLNTDAEGRLILADALWYAQERFSSQVIIDVATLTGAVKVALGPEYGGLFGTCETLIQTLKSCGALEGEKFWPLPLDPAFDRSLDSDHADMKNIANVGYGAGSSIGAQFLKRFIRPGQKWAHLDIANVDHVTVDHPLCPKGGCAFGVQTLYAYLLTLVASKPDTSCNSALDLK